MSEQRGTLPGRMPRVLRWVNFSVNVNSENLDEADREALKPKVAEGIEQANLVTSEIDLPMDQHAPVIDLDVPAYLVPSTTEGHSHLYIDAAIPWAKYVALLEALADAGLVERGYVNASKTRGYTAVRLPWVRKKKGDKAA